MCGIRKKIYNFVSALRKTLKSENNRRKREREGGRNNSDLRGVYSQEKYRTKSLVRGVGAGRRRIDQNIIFSFRLFASVSIIIQYILRFASSLESSSPASYTLKTHSRDISDTKLLAIHSV